MEEKVAIGRHTAERGLEGDVATWAVELKEARKTYRTGPIEIPALRGVSLQIAPGEFLAIAGPSGSGKTTLLNIIGGLDRADDGEVWVEGKNLQLLSSGDLARVRLERLGFVFQAYNLLPVLTAMENAEFTLLLQGVPVERRRERVQKLFLEIGLAGLENRRPGELSGGQRQRVAVARAMVTEPALILSDDPTTPAPADPTRFTVVSVADLSGSPKTVTDESPATPVLPFWLRNVSFTPVWGWAR